MIFDHNKSALSKRFTRYGRIRANHNKSFQNQIHRLKTSNPSTRLNFSNEIDKPTRAPLKNKDLEDDLNVRLWFHQFLEKRSQANNGVHETKNIINLNDGQLDEEINKNKQNYPKKIAFINTFKQRRDFKAFRVKSKLSHRFDTFRSNK